MYVYNASKKNWGVSSRDFYNKLIQFEHNGVIYKYISSVNNSEEIRPASEKDTVRAEQIFNMSKCYRSPEDMKIRLEVIS